MFQTHPKASIHMPTVLLLESTDHAVMQHVCHSHGPTDPRLAPAGAMASTELNLMMARTPKQE